MSRQKTSRTLTLAISIAVVLSQGLIPDSAAAGCVAVYSSAMMSRLPRGSSSRVTLPAHVTTKAQCEAYTRSVWPSASSWELNQVSCECNGSGGGSSGFTIPPGATLGQTMALGILSAALAPTPGPSAEEIARKKAQEEEARRLAEEEAKRKAEEERRWQEAERLRRQGWVEQMKHIDDDSTVLRNNSGGPRHWKGIDHSLTASSAPGSGSQNGGMSTLQRLGCAQALSDAAEQYAEMNDPEAKNKARFYAAQAQKALNGERLEVDCPTAIPSHIPEASAPQLVYTGEENIEKLQKLTRVDADFLSIVRSKKQELSERKSVVVAKKKTAEETIAKVPPSDDSDKLKAEAEALLRESEAELASIDQDEEGLDKEEVRLSENLQRYSEKTQQLTQGVSAQ